MSMETMGFKDKESRDALWRTWREEKSEGLARYSTHLDNLPEIIYAVTRRDPVSDLTQPSQDATSLCCESLKMSTKVLETQTRNRGTISSGGNNAEITEPVRPIEDGQHTDITPDGTPPLVPAV